MRAEVRTESASDMQVKVPRFSACVCGCVFVSRIAGNILFLSNLADISSCCSLQHPSHSRSSNPCATSGHRLFIP